MEELNNWGKWSKYVILTIDEIKRDLKTINSKTERFYVIEEIREEIKLLQINIDKIRLEIIALKIKSGIWGLIAGSIPIIILLIIKYLL
jgi:hypothetical protein